MSDERTFHLSSRGRGGTLVGVLLAVVVGIAAASDPKAAALLDGARAAQGDYAMLRASFTQERSISLIEGSLRSSGTFLLDRGGRVAWVVAEPEPLRVVLSSAGIFVDGRRVDREAPAGVGPLLVARGFVDFFAASAKDLERAFDLELAGPDRVRLRPKAEDLRRWIGSVELAFAGARKLPTEIVLHELGGDTTTIRLADVELEAAVDEKAFAP